MHWKMFSNTSGLFSSRCYLYSPSCDSQKCLRSLPYVSQEGRKLSLLENHCPAPPDYLSPYLNPSMAYRMCPADRNFHRVHLEFFSGWCFHRALTHTLPFSHLFFPLFLFWPPHSIQSFQARDQIQAAVLTYAGAATTLDPLTYSVGPLPSIGPASRCYRDNADPICVTAGTPGYPFFKKN